MLWRPALSQVLTGGSQCLEAEGLCPQNENRRHGAAAARSKLALVGEKIRPDKSSFKKILFFESRLQHKESCFLKKIHHRCFCSSYAVKIKVSPKRSFLSPTQGRKQEDCAGLFSSVLCHVWEGCVTPGVTQTRMFLLCF